VKGVCSTSEQISIRIEILREKFAVEILYKTNMLMYKSDYSQEEQTHNAE